MNADERKPRIPNAAKILHAYMQCCGVTDSHELAEQLGIPLRTIQHLKREAAQLCDANSAKGCAQTAQHLAPAQMVAPQETQNAALEAQDVAPSRVGAPAFSMEVSNNIYKPTNSEYDAARVDVVGSASPGMVECKTAFNGSTEAMLADIESFMVSGDRQSAVRWLTNMLGIHGKDAVQSGYQAVLNARADGSIVSKPLQFWNGAAARTKQAKTKRKMLRRPGF